MPNLNSVTPGSGQIEYAKALTTNSVRANGSYAAFPANQGVPETQADVAIFNVPQATTFCMVVPFGTDAAAEVMMLRVTGFSPIVGENRVIPTLLPRSTPR